MSSSPWWSRPSTWGRHSPISPSQPCVYCPVCQGQWGKHCCQTLCPQGSSVWSAVCWPRKGTKSQPCSIPQSWYCFWCACLPVRAQAPRSQTNPSQPEQGASSQLLLPTQDPGSGGSASSASNMVSHTHLTGFTADLPNSLSSLRWRLPSRNTGLISKCFHIVVIC